MESLRKSEDGVERGFAEVLDALFVMLDHAEGDIRRRREFLLRHSAPFAHRLETRLRMRGGIEPVQVAAETEDVHFVVRRVARDHFVNRGEVIDFGEGERRPPLIVRKRPSRPVLRRKVGNLGGGDAETVEQTLAYRKALARRPDWNHPVAATVVEVCGSAGYYERGSQVVCKRCDVVMNINTIGFKGGCNPIPLAYEVNGGSLIFRLEDLLTGEKEFR